tara:strand:- start:1674 stop:2660 length:987 start_codon:yes stop_codon:yes gene_type:complete
MNKAPGLNIIILIFFIFIFSIIFYTLWYFQTDKITSQHLESIQNKLLNKNIELTWDETTKSGFPYRIEIGLKNINLKFNNTKLSTEKLKIIYQPWNKKHIIFLFPNDIKILNENKKITIHNSKVLASLTIDKFENKIISIVSDKIRFNFKNKIYYFKKIESHLQTNETDDLKFAILIDKSSLPPIFIKENIINKLYINGEAIKYKNFDINNYLKWFSKEGGIQIESFKLDFNETNITGNAFISLDKNFDIQNTLSIYSNKLNNIFSLLEKNNYISKNNSEKANLIINAIEVASKLSNKEAIFSINIKNGYLYFMGIKLIKVPNLQQYL